MVTKSFPLGVKYPAVVASVWEEKTCILFPLGTAGRDRHRHISTDTMTDIEMYCETHVATSRRYHPQFRPQERVPWDAKLATVIWNPGELSSDMESSKSWLWTHGDLVARVETSQELP